MASRGRIAPLVFALLVFAAGTACGAEDGASGVAAEPFKDGDVVCFVGDSITRGGWFHSNVFLFYTTRFPRMSLRTFNAGRSGDRASGALGRLPWDVLPHKPNVVVVSFGMNDVNSGTLDEAIEQLEKLTGALRDAGCRVTLVTPTLYDESTALDAPLKAGKNASLTAYAGRVRDMARRHGHGLVDFNALMQRVESERRGADPAFTLIGRDRIHPGEIGHFVMAYAFLKAQGMPRDVAHIGVDAATLEPAEPFNCKVELIRSRESGIEFTCTEYALPFVPAEGANPALELVPFMDDLNREILVVRNLAAGTYELRIDGLPVGDYTAAELTAGIDLAGNSKTPQYQQSLKVTEINARRHDIESNALRGVAYVHSMLLKAGIDPEDHPAAEQHLRNLIEERKNKPDDFGKKMAEGYVGGWRADAEKNRALVEELIEAMRKESQPVSHRWSLARK